LVGEGTSHEARGKNEPVRETKFFNVARARACNDRKDPKNRDRKRRTPLSCEEINEREKKIHAHFVRQTPERRDCGFRVSEILKEKNVGENPGGMQVDEKKLPAAKVANRDAKQFDKHPG
jgi:hypothetical protein